MKVTYFGTTTLLFDDGRDQLLFDAHWTRPSLGQYLTGAKTGTDIPLCDRMIRRYGMDRLRAIFISHTHHDHVMDAPAIANRCGATVYGSESARNVALGGGVPEERIVVFRHGSVYHVGDFRVRILRSRHSMPTIVNNDLGVAIAKPLVQPVSLRDYKEGGSYDFVLEHGDRTVVIRPSFSHIRGQLDGIRADVLFLGVAGLGKASGNEEEAFFAETVEKTQAGLVIPIHWDNFFSPLEQPIQALPGFMERSGVMFHRLGRYCADHHVNCVIQYPGTSIEI